MPRRNLNESRVCSRCGRKGTHQFAKDERGHDICSNFTACKRRYLMPLYRYDHA